MSYIKLGFASLVSACLGGVASFIVVNPSTHLASSNQQTCRDIEAIAIQLRMENAQLLSDNHRLREVISANEQRAVFNKTTSTANPINPAHQNNTHRQNDTTNHDTTNNEKVRLDTSLQETTKNAIAASTRFNEWLKETYKKSPHFDLGHEMSNRFAQEQVDANWAPAREQTFMRLFSEDANLSGTALKDVQCRATQCQLNIGITNIEQANDITVKLTQILQTHDKNAFVIAAPDHQKGVTTLYIAKDENSFEFNESL